MGYSEVRKLVLSCDDEKMTEQMLQQLLKYLPNKEQVSGIVYFFTLTLIHNDLSFP